MHTAADPQACPDAGGSALRARTAVVVAGLILIRFGSLLAKGREYWISFVPDDAFYYLGFGRGFASTGRWTFDGGISLSSGFHVLHAYLAAACWALLHGFGDDLPTHALMLSSTVCAALAVLVCLRLVSSTFGPLSSIAVAIVFFSKNALICSASGMEWSVAVLTLALATEVALVGSARPRTEVCRAWFIGLSAVLARSDSFIWIAVLVASGFLVHRSAHARRLLGLGFGGLCGALLVACHTRAITGQWLQDSVLAKLHWSERLGIDVPGGLHTVAMATSLSWLGKGIDQVALSLLVIWGLAAAFFSSKQVRAALLSASFTLLAVVTLAAKNSGGLQYGTRMQRSFRVVCSGPACSPMRHECFRSVATLRCRWQRP